MTSANELAALADLIQRDADWATGISSDQDKLIVSALRLAASQPDREAIKVICIEHASLNMTVDAAHRQADRITNAILALLSGEKK